MKRCCSGMRRPCSVSKSMRFRVTSRTHANGTEVCRFLTHPLIFFPIMLSICFHTDHFAKGATKPDYEGDFWADEDEEFDTRSRREEYPESFIWQCCKKRGDEEGCQIGVHRQDVWKKDDGEKFEFGLRSPNGVKRARMQDWIDGREPFSFDDLMRSA
jgi:hypothetical protein